MTIALNSYSISANGILTVDATITAPGGQYIRRYTVQNGSDCLDECYPPWTYELVTSSYYNWKSGTLVTSKRRVSQINLAAWPNGTLILNLKAEYRTSSSNNISSSESGPSITIENTYNVPLLPVVDTPELAYSSTNLGYRGVEYVVPVVLTFTVPTTATGLTVPITLVAEDNNAVTGWLVTESATKPAATDSRWLAEAPTGYVVSGEGAKTLYAWAKDADGRVSSEVVARSVTVELPKVTATPTPGTYSAAQTVTLARANFTGGTIYYTLDGSDPTTASAVYSAPITVTESTTIKVLAADADGNQGAVKIFDYVVASTVVSDDMTINMSAEAVSLVGQLAASSSTIDNLASIASLSSTAALTAISATISSSVSTSQLTGQVIGDSSVLDISVTSAQLTGELLSDSTLVLIEASDGVVVEVLVSNGAGSIRSPSGFSIVMLTGTNQPIKIYRYINGMWQ